MSRFIKKDFPKVAILSMLEVMNCPVYDGYCYMQLEDRIAFADFYVIEREIIFAVCKEEDLKQKNLTKYTTWWRIQEWVSKDHKERFQDFKEFIPATQVRPTMLKMEVYNPIYTDD